jgi:hypothetical protein
MYFSEGGQQLHAEKVLSRGQQFPKLEVEFAGLKKPSRDGKSCKKITKVDYLA